MVDIGCVPLRPNVPLETKRDPYMFYFRLRLTSVSTSSVVYVLKLKRTEGGSTRSRTGGLFITSFYILIVDLPLRSTTDVLVQTDLDPSLNKPKFMVKSVQFTSRWHLLTTYFLLTDRGTGKNYPGSYCLK